MRKKEEKQNNFGFKNFNLQSAPELGALFFMVNNTQQCSMLTIVE